MARIIDTGWSLQIVETLASGRVSVIVEFDSDEREEAEKYLTRYNARKENRS